MLGSSSLDDDRENKRKQGRYFWKLSNVTKNKLSTQETATIYAFFDLLMQWAASSSGLFFCFFDLLFSSVQKEKAGLVSAKLIITWCLASYRGLRRSFIWLYVKSWIRCHLQHLFISSSNIYVPYGMCSSSSKQYNPHLMFFLDSCFFSKKFLNWY